MALAQAQKATISNEEVYFYSQPDFDSPVVGTASLGQVFDISTGKKDAFYKIRLQPGKTAWVGDNDVRLGVVQSLVDAAERGKQKMKKDAKADKKPKRAFDMTRFRGPAFEMIQFKESTLGGRQSENLSFFGLKVAGPNTMFDGDLQTNADVLVHLGAPQYYQDKTGNSANGWIFTTHFMFENVTPVTSRYNYFFGFGPMFKYSHFELGLTSGSRQLSYSADDMSIGAIFHLGLAFKISDYALRLEAKYYWEKESYLSGGLSFLFPF